MLTLRGNTTRTFGIALALELIVLGLWVLPLVFMINLWQSHGTADTSKNDKALTVIIVLNM